jgi:hypothetical protein
LAGEEGLIFTYDPPDEWVVEWDITKASVHPEDQMELVERPEG